MFFSFEIITFDCATFDIVVNNCILKGSQKCVFFRDIKLCKIINREKKNKKIY